MLGLGQLQLLQPLDDDLDVDMLREQHEMIERECRLRWQCCNLKRSAFYSHSNFYSYLNTLVYLIQHTCWTTPSS